MLFRAGHVAGSLVTKAYGRQTASLVPLKEKKKSSSTCWGCGKGHDSALPTACRSSWCRNAHRQRWLTPHSILLALPGALFPPGQHPSALLNVPSQLCASGIIIFTCLHVLCVISLSPALQARKSLLPAAQRVPEQLLGEGKLSLHNPGTYWGRMLQSYSLLGKIPLPCRQLVWVMQHRCTPIHVSDSTSCIPGKAATKYDLIFLL